MSARHQFTGWLLANAVLITVSACKKSEPNAVSQSASAPAAEVTAKLAKADAYDGTEDNVVSKCAACKLGMDGSSAHALDVHGYTMHFCSSGCKDYYEQDPDKAILALNVPE